ncbi:Ku protein [Oxalobacteraceae bacterium OM1]|nr:Ku protein [Oxalobacteraceae bacterium OM1]
MAARSIADLSLSFGLVYIPVKLYSATQSKDAISFHLLHKGCGSRLRQQYVCLKEDVPVERSQMVKGYEFAKDQYVVFTPDELKMLEEEGSHSVDIVAFIPEQAIDPLYYDKAYYLAPDKRGEKPYALLLEGMRKAGRCALARWSWRGKVHTVQVRPGADGGLVLQQLLYANEVRAVQDIGLKKTAEVKQAELELALQLIKQISEDRFDPNQYEDDVAKRIEEAIEKKIAGQEVTVSDKPEHRGADVIDLMEALRASLAGKPASAKPAAPKARKPAKRVASAPAPATKKPRTRKS